jgi:hypothetical protein
MRRTPALLALTALAVSGALAGCDLGDEPERPPALGARADDEEAIVKLGFPSTATTNTVRIGGGDAIADAAGVASVVYPATGPATRPAAVVLVDADDWRGGIAAAVLAGEPLRAPILLSDGGDLPPVTKDTLERLQPKGGVDEARGLQVVRVGDSPPAPAGLRSRHLRGADPYAVAAEIDRFATVLRGEPSDDVVIASGERAEYAMPAAAWAARSGDAVLFAQRDSVPPATLRALRAHERPDVFVLGPETVLTKRVERQLRPLARRVRRIQGPTPVQNAIAFARYSTRGFGWGIEVPGYTFAIASTARPLDAAAAAPLGTNGVFAPLLVTDRAEVLPRSLEDYLLDVQPGYEGDPSNAVYNRVWILGDDRTISVAAQARLDQVTQLVPVRVPR